MERIRNGIRLPLVPLSAAAQPVVAEAMRRAADEAYDKGGLEDAEWVGWRLAEWLPLMAHDRQRLLQENDPHRRLQQIVERLPEFQAD